MVAPLEGIRVLELTSWMAAPSAAAVLADLGADVVKVEPLRGDPMRGMSRQPKAPEGRAPVDASFLFDNRGKRSVAVAVDRPEGADLVHRLVAGADVLVTNLLPHRQARYGLDPESLFPLNGRLVHATLTGYGTSGPEAWRPGYDVTAFFGRGAVSDSLLEPGGVPPQPRPAQGDHTTGLSLVVAVLAGLRMVERTGQAQAVETSLFATAVWTMATDVAPTLVDRRQPQVRDRHHLISALANRFPCKDGRWIILNMPEPQWWPRFCETVAREGWASDPRFATPKARFDNMAELVDAMDELFGGRTLDEWGDLFDAAGLIWGPAQRLVELVDDPQARAEGFFPAVEHPEAGRVETIAVPFRLRGAEVGPRGPAPAVGQHTREVLAGLGLGEAEIDELVAAGTVA